MSETDQNNRREVFLATPSSGEALPTALRLADGENLTQITASEVRTDPATGQQSVLLDIQQILGDKNVIVRRVVTKPGDRTT